MGRSTTPHTKATVDSKESSVDILSTVVKMLRHWRLLVTLPFVTATVTAAVSLVLPAKYTASAKFIQEVSSSGAMQSQLAGLAAQFGVLNATGPAQSPDFYADLLRSRTITDEVLLSRFGTSDSDADSVDLLTYLKVSGDGIPARLEKGRRTMRNVLSIGVDRRTNIINIAVELRDPVAAAGVANRYLQVLNNFNLNVRRSVGRVRRLFAERRMEEAHQALLDAEDQLRVFYERNTLFQDSPQLRFEEDRLQRAVSIDQELYLSVTREMELARVAEVNDMPVITVLDVAEPPVRRSFPRRKILVLGAALLAMFVAAGLALVRVVRDDFASLQPQTAATIRSVLAEVRADVRTSFGRTGGKGRSDGNAGG